MKELGIPVMGLSAVVLTALLASIGTSGELTGQKKGKAAPFDARSWGIGGGVGGVYGARAGGKRLMSRGKDKTTPAAIERALRRLAKTQTADGSWSSERFDDVTVTSLALLAFLGDGSTLRTGPFKDQIKKAAVCLRGRLDEHGRVSGKVSEVGIVSRHALATLAMNEAYYLSQYPILKNNAVQMSEALRAGQLKSGAYPAGFESDSAELTATCWAVQAAFTFGKSRVADRVAFGDVDAWLDAQLPATEEAEAEAKAEVSDEQLATILWALCQTGKLKGDALKKGAESIDLGRMLKKADNKPSEAIFFAASLQSYAGAKAWKESWRKIRRALVTRSVEDLGAHELALQALVLEVPYRLVRIAKDSRSPKRK